MAYVQIHAGKPAEIPVTHHLGRSLALKRENNILAWHNAVPSSAALESLDACLLQICRHPGRAKANQLSVAVAPEPALASAP